MSYPIEKPESEWRAALSDIEYRVTREKATERAFTGRYWDCTDPGRYRCMCCGAPLFDAADKVDAGCGWPSFDRPAAEAPIETVRDTSHGMIRTEVLCAQCGAHLGHVFEDGPPTTGLRYCINSASLRLEPEER